MLPRTFTGKSIKLTKFQNFNDYTAFNGDYTTRISRLKLSQAMISKISVSDRLQYYSLLSCTHLLNYLYSQVLVELSSA